MAKRQQNPWFPSGGVLVVAVIAAVLAAILLNAYISFLKSSYEAGSRAFLQMKRDVPKGKAIETGDVQAVRIPKPLLESGAFAKAIDVKDTDSLVLKRKARRDLYQGEFLFYTDFLPDTSVKAIADLPRGYEMITIPIKPEPLLQPGAFVTIRGGFDVSPDPKKEDVEIMDVMYNVQVKAVGGSSAAIDEKRRIDDNVQIMLRSTQVKELLQIKEALVTKNFMVSLSPSEGATSEPKFATQILDLMAKSKAGGAPATP